MTKNKERFELLKERNIILTGNVAEANCAELVQKIIDINLKDDVMEEMEVGYVREPIKLTIDSYGGCCYSGNGLIGTILTSKTPVWTYCHSKAMSMGQLTFIAGERRFIGPQATIMFHGVATGATGYLPAVETKLEEGRRLEEKGTKLTVARTKVSRDKLEGVIKEKTEWFFDAEQAIEYGFATDLL
ncbi:Clp protease [Vibrio phage 2.275.O._10N.286.54.E11]|nr:Clp protease [Vibrio phage 2.275.O._10N.286.54.E11]